MSVEAISWAIREAPVTNPTDQLVLLVLAEHADAHAVATVSTGDLAWMTNLGRTTIFNSFHRLKAHGLIQAVSSGTRGVVSYRLALEVAGRSPRPISQDRRKDWTPARRWRLIAQIVARDGVTCGLCGKDVHLDEVHLDHDLPLVLGGDSDIDNLQLAHGDCNLRKGGRLVPRVLAPIAGPREAA